VTRADVDAWAAAREALVPVAAGVSLEVRAQGEGDPVLLLPGFGADISVFARQVPELALTHRVLGVNPRGVGLSDAPEQERYDVAQAASDAAAVSEAPAHVVGASLGAAVAIELALAHPEAFGEVADDRLEFPLLTFPPVARTGGFRRVEGDAAEGADEHLVGQSQVGRCGSVGWSGSHGQRRRVEVNHGTEGLPFPLGVAFPRPTGAKR